MTQRAVLGGMVALWLSGCVHKPPDPAFGAEAPLDVVLVPGCPVLPDGTLSTCLKQRAAWASVVWERGWTRTFITSGNAVRSPFVEAVALRDAMVHLGVPADVIHTETQALHTDENVGFALAMLDELHLDSWGMASHGGQASGMRAFSRGWGKGAARLAMEGEAVEERVQRLSTLEVPAVAPIPTLKERERALRIARGKRFRRAPSVLHYTWLGLVGNFTRRAPPRALVPEPTL